MNTPIPQKINLPWLHRLLCFIRLDLRLRKRKNLMWFFPNSNIGLMFFFFQISDVFRININFFCQKFSVFSPTAKNNLDIVLQQFLSSVCYCNLLIWFGWTPVLLAISDIVRSPFISSSTTLALKDASYRFLFDPINHLLSCRITLHPQWDFTPYFSVRFFGYSILRYIISFNTLVNCSIIIFIIYNNIWGSLYYYQFDLVIKMDL